MSDTKDRIIESAIELFNDQGFVNVRLQNIADELKMSVGNLAYHFKNKESIIAVAYDRIGEELSSILSRYRSTPDLRDLEHQLELYFGFITKFPFYFIDILEVKRNHPYLHEQRKTFINKMRIQLEKRIEYNISRGVLVSTITDDMIHRIADNMCSIVTFWLTNQAIKDEIMTVRHFKKSVWIQLYPFLTNKGLAEYSKFIEVGSLLGD
ncbi:MAG: TetR/AcrR family transcriptional regulator [Cyclobacteriaceae bacterium]